MSKVNNKGIEAMRELAQDAQGEIAEAVANLPPEGSKESLDICLAYIENVGIAADMSDFSNLKLVADTFLSHLEESSSGLTPDLGMDIVGWLGDVLLHIDSPDDADIVEILLTPLPADLQIGLRAKISGKTVVVDESVALSESVFEFDSQSESDEDDSTDDISDALDMNSLEITESDEEDELQFDTDSMLGILASELYDVSPQLKKYSQVISSTENADELGLAVGSYLELVSRVHMASEGLGLHGLVQICDFVNNNLNLIAELAQSQRADSLMVMQGWPKVVIQHLAAPKDDSLCLAVVDFLELEDWPEPLPYRSLRSLIEGLTKELEMTGDYEVEARQTIASAENVELEMSEDASPELIDAFFAESPRHAETFSGLVEAIANGNDIPGNIEAAQRIAHTLKGSGNLVGVKGIANLAHHLEDIFDYIAKNHLAPPKVLAHTMQEAADTIEVMFEFLQGSAPPPEDAQRVLQDVLDWANRIDSGDIEESEPSDDNLVVSSATAIKEFVFEPDALVDEEIDASLVTESPMIPRKPVRKPAAEALPRAEAIRVPVDILDNIFRVVGETAISIGQIQERISRLESVNKSIRKNDVTLQQRRYQLENLVSVRGMAARHRTAVVSGGDGFDPLELDEYGELYSVAHAYIEGVADSREILRSITEELSEMNGQFQLQKRLNKELQQVVMTTRLVPVNSISARLHRAVRQASRTTGKVAELTIIGEDLLLDGEVLNKLADPLMHMLRNAIDHGIEVDDVRFDKGKEATGHIILEFLQQGKNVVVNCIDDGGGLDYKRIRETAIKRGLMSEQENYDNQMLARMILNSGFSTSDKVTQVSGRGVGMDVVHNTILSLGGTVAISDADNDGTQISLRLPITLLTSHCLLVGVGEGLVYAIPTSTLIQILSPGTGKISDVGGSMTFQLGQDVYPVSSLNSMLGRAEAADFDAQNSTVLLVQASDGVVAVTLERVVSSYDLVVKNMGAYVKNIRGVSGVSTLGDGSVVAVLDLPLLLQAVASSEKVVVSDSFGSAEVVDPKSLLPKVLIVDDSLSVRNSLTQLMRDGGYRVAVARDGLEAVDLLENEHPNIVLADLEMPRMNGLELANYIRKSENWHSLPIVMITSRTTAKHRQQADTAGINRFITKPFTEDDVLASIDELLIKQ